MIYPPIQIPEYITQKRYARQIDPDNVENLPYAIVVHRIEWARAETLTILPILDKPVIDVYTEIHLKTGLDSQQTLFTLPLPYLSKENPFRYELVYPNGKRKSVPLYEKPTNKESAYLYWHINSSKTDTSQSYTLEGYDKDSDVYLPLMSHHDKDILDNIQVAFQEIQTISDVFRRNNEPIDWFEVS